MILLDPPRRLHASADPWDGSGLSRLALSRFFARARKAVGLAGEVDVLLAGDATLKRLNRDFRGKDKPTDVLSFPSPEEIFEQRAGDLAISLQTAARQAKAYGHGLEDEVRILMLHGLLHLSGMDHEADRGEMAAREAELRAALKLPLGLIARVEAPQRLKPQVAQKSSNGRAKVQSAAAVGKRLVGKRLVGAASVGQLPVSRTPVVKAPVVKASKRGIRTAAKKAERARRVA
jgi:probable rRNA maturation factor